MSEANEVDGEDMDCWINNIDKPARIKKDSGIVLRRLKTIHFAHCVRSVAATHPSVFAQWLPPVRPSVFAQWLPRHTPHATRRVIYGRSGIYDSSGDIVPGNSIAIVQPARS